NEIIIVIFIVLIVYFMEMLIMQSKDIKAKQILIT
ncbi:unnamed protein product, partial [marine sediment metagenome]